MRVIAVGSLKEAYWRDAVNEYIKRLSGSGQVGGLSGSAWKVEIAEVKEHRLPPNPTPQLIEIALQKEAQAIRKACCPKGKTIALCVKGKP